MMYTKALIALAVLCFSSSCIVAANVVSETSPSVQDICSIMPAGSTILRPKSCTNWVRCPTRADGTDYEEGACVLGLYYNKDSESCESQDAIECPYTAQEKNRCNKLTEGAFLADPSSCNAYIFCKNGRETRSVCPSDLVFDPKKAACVYQTEYTCPVATNFEAKTPICRSIRNNAVFAHEEHCEMYNQCIDGVLTEHNCDHEMAFDHVKGRCVKSDGVNCLATAKLPGPEVTICGTKNHTIVGYLADTESCSSYYVCQKQEDATPDRNPLHVHCDYGFFFDAQKKSCRDRVNVRCDLDRCEGMGNKYVNVVGDCSAYIRCSNGVSGNRGTCPEKYFFDERTQGCTPQIVNYAACSA